MTKDEIQEQLNGLVAYKKGNLSIDPADLECDELLFTGKDLVKILLNFQSMIKKEIANKISESIESIL